MNNLAALPNINKASLPQTYEKAKTALAECSRIDECKAWADKAEALASYAKQAKDETLRKMAMRIQARAIRRCGELLRKIEPNKGGRPSKTREGDHPSLSRKQAAEDAGLSEHQRKTAIRVATVPEEEFETKTISDDPPTVSAFADIGTKRTAKDFQSATEALGTLRRFSEFCKKNDAEAVAAGVLSHEIKKAVGYVSAIDAWMDKFITSLED